MQFTRYSTSPLHQTAQCLMTLRYFNQENRAVPSLTSSQTVKKQAGCSETFLPVTQRLLGPAGLLCLDYSAFLSYYCSS